MEKKYDKWIVDLKKTYPALEIIKEKFFENSKILSIEKIDEEALIWLDQYSGIDWVEKNSENQLTTIAARIQWDINYKSFTIRSERHTRTKTEFAKRKEAIKNGFLYPIFTLHAYFENKSSPKLLSCVMVKTLDFYTFIKKHPDRIYEKESDNKFKIVYWNDLKLFGVKF